MSAAKKVVVITGASQGIGAELVTAHRVITEAVAKFGRIDTPVSNAGNMG